MLSQSTTILIKESFKELGLNSRHAHTFIASLVLGPATVTEISEFTDIPRSTSYGLLKTLTKRGLVSETKQDDGTIYSPVSPTKLELLIEQKFVDIGQKLEDLQSNSKQIKQLFKASQGDLPRFEFFQGESELKKALYDSLGANTILAVFNGSFGYSEASYIKDYMNEVQLREIKVYALMEDSEINRDFRNKYESMFFKTILFNIDQHLSFLSVDSEKSGIAVDKQIYEDKVFYINHVEKKGFRFVDHNIVMQERALFSALWQKYSQ